MRFSSLSMERNLHKGLYFDPTISEDQKHLSLSG